MLKCNKASLVVSQCVLKQINKALFKFAQSLDTYIIKKTDILLPLNEPIVPKSLNKGANITFEFEFITIMYFSTHFGTELNTLILKSKLCHT